MKIHTLKNRWFLPVLSCAALAMTSHSQAAVTVSFEQVGDDVVATWTGSIDVGDWRNDGVAPEMNSAWTDSFYAVSGAVEVYDGGTPTPTGLSGAIDFYAGSAGFVGVDFYVAGSNDGFAPGSPVYNFDTLGVTQTFADQTLAEIGATTFNDTLAWTSLAGGTNTISYTTVPEPSSTALIIGLGALALAVRRRR